MNKWTGAWVLILLLSFTAAAQKTIITGQAHGAEGKLIFVRTYNDFISDKEKELASGRIDSLGKFQLTLPIKEITYAWFCIEYYTGDIYLQPGTSRQYNLKGLLFNDEKDRINANLEPQLMNVQAADSNDLINLSIQRFNLICNRFLINHIKDVRTSKFRKELDTLKMNLDTVFNKVDIDYFKVYRKYRIATLEMISSRMSTDELFRKYILDKPILIDHVEYMDFIRQFFETYFDEVNRQVNLSTLRPTINLDKSYPKLTETFFQDSLLRNEMLLEIVMLETLKNLYAEPTFNKDNIVSILKQMAVKSKFEKHKRIAADLAEMLTRFEEGKMAPDFALLNFKEDTVRLKDFRGKFVYINFFTTWNVACLEELELMRKLFTKYDQSVQFVSICCDREYMKLYHFSRDHNYPWPLLHFNSDYKLLESYGVKTYPYFVLLDKKGRFISDPAENPSQNIEMKFMEEIQKSGNQ